MEERKVSQIQRKQQRHTHMFFICEQPAKIYLEQVYSAFQAGRDVTMEWAGVWEAEIAPFTGDRLPCDNQHTNRTLFHLESVKRPEQLGTQTQPLYSDLVC